MQRDLFGRDKPEPLTLRPYQQDAVNAVYAHLRTREDNPCVVIPTGGGKTPVIATICKDAVAWQGRVLILAHVKELLQQAADKLARVGVECGVYSAGLGRRDRRGSVIVAGIQSVYQKACDLDRFDLVLIDESHLIPPEGDGMYRQFLADALTLNPQLRIVGLTATPFRLSSGPICTPDGFLNTICYEIGVKQLIVEGYLSPLISKAGLTRADTSKLHVRGGEFVAGEVEQLVDDDAIVKPACKEIVELTSERKSVLIFSAGVEHGKHVQRTLQEFGHECGFVCGDTPDDERAKLLERFQAGELKYLANVNVLTTGFDAPNIDCVALLRPTLSPGLYYQMVGRGFRLSPGKANCLVLDFGGNVLRHGPVDQLTIKDASKSQGNDAAAKECPKCQAVIAAGYSACPQCGYVFPAPERDKHDTRASDAGVLSGQVHDETLEVDEIFYRVHTKRLEPEAPKSMRVDYRVGLSEFHSEWICLEHQGFARNKAVAWWKAHSPDPVPDTAARAVEIAEAGGVARAETITVRTVAGEKFERIIDYTLGPMPEPIPEAALATLGTTEEDIPF